MAPLIGASLLVVGFLALFHLLDLTTKARDALACSQLAMAELASRELDDDAKEQAMRAYAGKLARLFAVLMLGSVAAVCLPVLALLAADALGLISFDQVMQASLSWPFLVGAAVVTTGIMWLLARRDNPPTRAEPAFENRYSRTDRLLHNLAFRTTSAQIAVADMEDQLFRVHRNAAAVDRPVFITALPRAGTTLLLELCANTGQFVTHTYRHMPFVLLPLLWGRFSRPFRLADAPRERAHGDGMRVNADSPEAFEEILWLAFWQDHYLPDRIQPWPLESSPPRPPMRLAASAGPPAPSDSSEDSSDFLDFFRNHLRKLAMLQQHNGQPAPRYVSKNNLNIARIAYLTRVLPDACILIPFRSPLQQAASLLKQHRNFLDIHRADPFARRYMAGIGHFDFGRNLRPVNFDGWLDRGPLPHPTTLGFWLAYWIACYRHLATLGSNRVRFLDYDAFCAAPAQGLDRLAAFLQLNDPASLQAQHRRIRPPTPHSVDAAGIAPAVLQQAAAVHADLMQRSLL